MAIGTPGRSDGALAANYVKYRQGVGLQVLDYLCLALIISSSGLSLRDEYILSYADYLHSDPALWRITVDYMYSCANIGKSRADEVLLRVPLQLHEQTTDLRVDNRIRAGEIVGVLKDVNATCFEYRRESVRRTVCRVSPVSHSFESRPIIMTRLPPKPWLLTRIMV